MKIRNVKMGILGGSFNPPHLGHLFIAQTVYREFNLDGIMLLPLGMPPHKKNIAPKADRERMCRMLAKAAGNGMDVCTIELNREGYTYTVDTLCQLREKYPKYIFYYIIGTDTLFQLETWRDYRRVFAYTEFICVPRPGDDPNKVYDKIKQLDRQYGKKILLCMQSGPDISSTQIREEICYNRSTEGMLLPEIREYIDKERLYAE